MRVLFLTLLLVGLSQGFMLGTLSQISSSIGQAANNLWNGVTGHVNNVVDAAGNIHGQIMDTVNGIQFVSNFLWENTFNPALELFLEGGASYLDDKFGNLVSVVGRRSSKSENALSAKYEELIARFKANIHHLYEQLFEMEKEALQKLQKGENTLEDTIRAFHDKIAAIHNQVAVWADDLKNQLETHALTVEGDWANIIKQYSSNVDMSVQAMRTMFQKLAQDLMKNLVEVSLSVIPNAIAIVDNLKQQGLLSFLHH